jgi:hypothetical protein
MPVHAAKRASLADAIRLFGAAHRVIMECRFESLISRPIWNWSWTRAAIWPTGCSSRRIPTPASCTSNPWSPITNSCSEPTTFACRSHRSCPRVGKRRTATGGAPARAGSVCGQCPPSPRHARNRTQQPLRGGLVVRHNRCTRERARPIPDLRDDVTHAFGPTTRLSETEAHRVQLAGRQEAWRDALTCTDA